MLSIVKNKQAGFSLLELMVAIAITGIVFAGVMGAMNSLSSKTTANKIEMQIKAQMAFTHIGDAFKEAGASVCDNLMRGLMENKTVGTNGFIDVSSVLDNVSGTPFDGLGLILNNANISAGSFINDGAGTLVDSAAGNRATNRVVSSDMFNVISTGGKAAVLDYIEPGMTPAQQLLMRTQGPMTISNRPNNVPINDVFASVSAALAAPVTNQYTFVLSNCDTNKSEIFEAVMSATDNPNFPNPNPKVDLSFVGGGLSMRDPESLTGDLEVAALRSTTYFINNSATTGFSLSRFFGFNYSRTRALVVGVEMMDIQWGVDIDGDFSVDRFVSSDNVAGDNLINGGAAFTWDQVIAARVDIIIGEPTSMGNVDNTYTLNFPRGSRQEITYQRGVNPVIRNDGVTQPLPPEYVGIGHYKREVFSKTFTFRNKVRM